LPKPTLPHSVVITTVMTQTKPSEIRHRADVLAQKVLCLLYLYLNPWVNYLVFSSL